MGVGLVAAPDLAVVGLVAGVHVRVLLPVARVGEAAVAVVVLADKGLLACKQKKVIEWPAVNRSQPED